ncbi:hypothetical protein OEZ85_009408 [Tetradesmus obliquus]|uniref:Uncharacterized protein n=1 Tax=Tetradesmus obliquus TaxID=3088 RepID=A0ABY8UE28_TETOB|nr:hypothetical protein OEZ85_009408 [Tetradesmus obliquus]
MDAEFWKILGSGNHAELARAARELRSRPGGITTQQAQASCCRRACQATVAAMGAAAAAAAGATAAARQ